MLVKHAGLTVAVAVVVGGVIAAILHGPGDRQAIAISMALGVAVQLAAFTLGQKAGRVNLMARLGTGALLRLFTLVIYAVLVTQVFKLPAVAALVSLVVFFFLSTLLEPLLIKS